MKLDDWLHTNTFHHSYFWNIEDLVKHKEEQDITISLGIPTLNEEKTIGKEIVLFKSELMTRYPLLDEIAIIDSGSTDKTMEIAATFGADVYLANEILPELGEKRGKGENLWKAIYQLQGDILVFIDADIKNIHRRFVCGLVAPLIYCPEIKYVKSFFERPLGGSQHKHSSDGSRITEILVRPLLSIFLPELNTIVQPLSGQRAVRREVLERIPFPIGDGIEIANLVDVYNQFGPEVFGQVDLDYLIHRNHSTRNFSKMAFGILHAFLSRISPSEIERHRSELHQTLYQFIPCETSLEQLDYTIHPEERPPMINIPAYRQKFRL